MDYIPSVFDNYSMNLAVDDRQCSIGLWDTAGQEDYDRLRPLSYPETDLFFICFSVISPSSFENLERWVSEIQHHCPGAPFLFIATKSDLRTDSSTLERLAEKKLAPVPQSEIKDAVKRFGAAGYLECSALTQEGLKEVFLGGSRIIIAGSSLRKKKTSFVSRLTRRMSLLVH